MLSQYIELQDGLMSTKPYDLVLRGGTVATSSAVFPADVAIDGETIAAVGRDLPPASSTPIPSKAPPSRRHSGAPQR